MTSPPKVVLALNTQQGKSADAKRCINIAVNIANEFRSELLTLLIIDPDLEKVSKLPFTKEIRPYTNGLHTTSQASLDRDIEKFSESIKNKISRSANKNNIRSRFIHISGKHIKVCMTTGSTEIMITSPHQKFKLFTRPLHRLHNDQNNIALFVEDFEKDMEIIKLAKRQSEKNAGHLVVIMPDGNSESVSEITQDLNIDIIRLPYENKTNLDQVLYFLNKKAIKTFFCRKNTNLLPDPGELEKLISKTTATLVLMP